MPTADVNGITINYSLEGGGDGDLIVLVNGLADDSLSWDSQVPTFLEAGYKVLRYDNRGIGKTSRPKGPYTASLLATDLHGLLVHLSIKECHILGVSMGGMIAQSYALAYSSTSATTTSQNPKILSLTLGCTYASPSPFCTRMFGLWADMATKMSVRDVMRDTWLWCLTVPMFLDRENEVKEFEDAMDVALDMSTETYLDQLNVIQVFDTRDELKALKVRGDVLGGVGDGRVLVLAGEEDILIPVMLSRILHALIKGAVWKTTRGGHAASFEFPDEFNKTYLDFVTGLR